MPQDNTPQDSSLVDTLSEAQWMEYWGFEQGSDNSSEQILLESLGGTEVNNSLMSEYPEVYNKETKNIPLTEEADEDSAKEMVSDKIIAPTNSAEELLQEKVITEGVKTSVGVSKVGNSAESLLQKAVAGQDVSVDIRTIVEKIRAGDDALFETEIYGHAYGPFQLFDRFHDGTAMNLHNKPVSELNRYEQYQTAREIYDKRGWAEWNAYTDGSYKKFMPEGGEHVEDADLSTLYNIPAEEVVYLRDDLFADDWDMAKAIMLAESGKPLAQDGPENIITVATKEKLSEQALYEEVTRIIPNEQTAISQNPFDQKLAQDYYVDEDGELKSLTGMKPPNMEERILNGIDAHKKYGKRIDQMFANVPGIESYSDKEEAIMYSAWQWVKSGDFEEWWSKKGEGGLGNLNKAMFEGIVEQSLTSSLLHPYHATLLNYAFHYAGMDPEDRSWTEHNLAPVFSFLAPVDALTFMGGTRAGGLMLRPLMTRQVEKFIGMGYSKRRAIQAVEKGVWMPLIMRMNSIGLGMGAYNTAHNVNRMLQASDIQGNELSSALILKDFAKSYGLGASVGATGMLFGRSMNGIHNYLNKHGVTKGIGEPQWSPTVADFVGEALMFTVGGKATENPEEWVDTDRVKDLFTKEVDGVRVFDTGEFRRAFSQTSFFLLAMRALNKLALRDMLKPGEVPDKSMETLEKYEGQQLELMLETRVIEKMAKEGNKSVNGVNEDLKQVELFPDSEVKIKVTNGMIKETLVEIATELGIQMDLPLKTVYENIKKRIENPDKESQSKEQTLELFESEEQNKNDTDANGTIVDIPKKTRKRQARERQQQKDNLQATAEESKINVHDSKEPTNDRLRKAIESGRVDDVVDVLKTLEFVTRDGKTANNTRRYSSFKAHVKRVIGEMQKTREIRRETINIIRDLKSVGQNLKNSTPEQIQAYKNYRKSARLEKKLFNHYEQILLEVGKASHTGKPNIKSINHHRDSANKLQSQLEKLGVVGYDPLRSLDWGVVGGVESSSKPKSVDKYNKENNNPLISTTYRNTLVPPPALPRHQILYTSIPEDVNSKKVKRNIAKDGKEGWGANMISIKPFDTELGAKMKAREIMSDYIGEWREHYVQYFPVKDGKGNTKWHIRIMKGDLKSIEERFEEVAHGVARIMPRERFEANQIALSGSGHNPPDAMRDPYIKTSNDRRIEVLDHDIKGLQAQVDHMATQKSSLESLIKKALEASGDPVPGKPSRATAIDTYREDIERIDASQKKTRKVLRDYSREKKRYMEMNDLINEVNRRNEELSVGLGAVGFYDKSVWKKMGADVKGGANQLKELLKVIWTKAPHVSKMRKEEFMEWITKQGLKDPALKKWIGKEYEQIKTEATLENFTEIYNHMNDADFEVYGDGPQLNLRSKNRKGDYSGAMNFAQFESSEAYGIVKAFYSKLGTEFEKTVRGTKTFRQIRYNSRKAKNQKIVADYIMNGKVVTDAEGKTEYINESGALDMSAHQELAKANLGVIVKMYIADPKNKYIQDILTKHVFLVGRIASEAGRTLRMAGVQGDAKAPMKDLMDLMEKRTSSETGDQAKENFDMLVQSLYGAMANDPNFLGKGKESPWFWKWAELSRNMKLMSGSSYAKSVVGNSTSTALEGLNKLISPALSFMIDPKRKYSGIRASHSIKTGLLQLESAFGVGNILNPKLLIERARGLKNHSLLYESLWGDKGAWKMGWKLLAEDKEAILDNPWLYHEGFTRHLRGSTVGEVLTKFGLGQSVGKMPKDLRNFPMGWSTIRTLQNLHGAMDLWWRMPAQTLEFNNLAHNIAVKELRAMGKEHLTEDNILRRIEEITDDPSSRERLMSEAKEYGRFVVFQEPFHSGLAQKINSMRVRQDKWWSGMINWKFPFVLTYANGLKKMAEYSPAGLIMYRGKDAWARAGLFGKQARENSHFSSLRIAPDRDALAQVLGRTTVGSGMYYMLAQLARSIDVGNLWGSWEDLSPENRSMLHNQGMNEYSINLGDGDNKYNYTYRGMADPLSGMFQWAVAYVNSPDDPVIGTKFQNSLESFAKMLRDNPLATNLTDVQKVMEGRKTREWFVIKSLIGEQIPTIMKQLESFENNTVKRTGAVDNLEQAGPFNKIVEWAFDGGPYELTEFNKQALKDAFRHQTKPLPKKIMAPIMWAFGIDGSVDPHYSVIDLFGEPVTKSKSLWGLTGVRVTPVKSTPLRNEYQRLFVDDNKTLRQQAGNFTDGEQSVQLTAHDLHLVHFAVGQGFRRTMETVHDMPGYQTLKEFSTYVPLTSEEKSGLSPEEIEGRETTRKEKAFGWRRHLRDNIWSRTHNALKGSTRQYYLHGAYNITKAQDIMQNLSIIADELELYSGKAKVQQMEESLSLVLKEAVYEKDESGEWTDKALEAQTKLSYAYELLNSKDDYEGSREKFALGIIKEYAKGIPTRKLLLARKTVQDIAEGMHPYVNLEDFRTELDVIQEKIRAEVGDSNLEIYPTTQREDDE